MYSWQQANKFKADESYLPHYLKSDNARKLVVTHRFTSYNITQKNTIVIMTRANKQNERGKWRDSPFAPRDMPSGRALEFGQWVLLTLSSKVLCYTGA